MVRQVREEGLAQCGTGDLAGSGRGHDMADQQGAAVVAVHGDGGVAHGGQRRQGRLDLAELHPEPADLDLVVGPAQELQVAVRAEAHPVTGAVQPGAGGERVGDEPLGGQLRPAPVAAAHPVAADEELTADAHGHRVEVVVQDVHPGVGQWAADGDERAATEHVGGGGEHRGVDGHLGRAVGVDDQGVGVEVVQQPQAVVGAPAFGADGQQLQPRQPGAAQGDLGDQRVGEGRYQFEGVAAGALDEFEQPGRVGDDLGRADRQGAAEGQ